MLLYIFVIFSFIFIISLIIVSDNAKDDFIVGFTLMSGITVVIIILALLLNTSYTKAKFLKTGLARYENGILIVDSISYKTISNIDNIIFSPDSIESSNDSIITLKYISNKLDTIEAEMYIQRDYFKIISDKVKDKK